jgi:predicted ATPase/DNA-binding CsgD family transcriptional regulator
MDSLRRPTRTYFASEQQLYDAPRLSGFLRSQLHQVSLPLTPLIGREHERKTVGELLMRPETRLVTLTGAGGIGKTRLALQVADDVRQSFADGCALVPLASIRQPRMVLFAIIQALQFEIADDLSYFEYLRAFLRDKSFLLILDNFEQVLTAASMLESLLSACPGLKLLVTSRISLPIQGECEFPVPPLALPDLHHQATSTELLDTPSVALFIQRALAARRDLPITGANINIIAEICARLDGLPLAIELAATRIQILTPRELLSRLKHRLHILTNGGMDLPERQRTLRNTMDWSYDLLNPEEQRLFRLLSIFTNGCTLDAAEALCTASGFASASILDGIESMLGKSLLLRRDEDEEHSRFLMLETIREYGLERLEECGELARLRDAHAHYYLAFVEQAEPGLRSAEQNFWLMEVERERGNIEDAMRWLEEGKREEMLLRIAGALGQFWFLRGYMSEGRLFLEQRLAALHTTEGHAVPVSLKTMAKAFFIAGWLAYWQGDFAPAISYLEESIELYRNLQDKRGIAASLDVLGVIKKNHGDFETGQAMHEEAMSYHQETGDQYGLAELQTILGIEAIYRGEFARTRALCRESLTYCERAGDLWGIATNLHFLGWVAYCQDEFEAARQLLERSLLLLRRVGKPGFTADALYMLACTHVSLENYTLASTMFAEVFVLGKDLGIKQDTASALCGIGQLLFREGNVVQARLNYLEAFALLKEIWVITKINKRVKWLLACCLEGLGEVALAQGKAAWTAQLFGAAETIRATFGFWCPLRTEASLYSNTLAAVRAQLGEEAFAAFWAAGQSMTPEQAVNAEARTPEIKPVIEESTEMAIESGPRSFSQGLTAREIQVLRLIATGATNKQIAGQLFISPRTVNVHVQSIFSKLRVNSRNAATRVAIDHHLT